jgi:hypothetical protein
LEDVKVLQIMPAAGWVAVYDDGEEGEMEEPLAPLCVTLVQVDYKNDDGIQTEYADAARRKGDGVRGRRHKLCDSPPR